MQLVFIHGSGGCAESFRAQLSHFENSDAVNLPGHPDGELIPTIEGAAAWLHDYITDKGYQDVVIAGHSLGGGIALQYALDYADGVKGIITLGSGGRLRVLPATLEALRKQVANPSPEGSSDGGGGGGGGDSLIEPELAAIIARRRQENGPKAMLNDMEACDKFDVMERLSEITLPVLAVVGSGDVQTPPKYSQYMADNLPDASAVIIEGTTHFAYAEKPDEVNAAIDEFLARFG